MTSIANSRGALILVAGDLVAYVFSLILTLTIRYGHIPDRGFFMSHAPSFGILFVIFLLVSFSAGLYDKQSGFIHGRIQGLLARVQIANLAIGIAFFYFAPVVIAPKANLFIYFVVSTALLIVWRTIMFPVVNMSRKQSAIIIGSGDDIQDIQAEINANPRYGLIFREFITPAVSVQDTVARIAAAAERTGALIIVADLNNPSIQSAMPFLYSLIFSGVQVIDAGKLYESIFDRIPISMVGERWLVEHSGTALGSRRTYDIVKRLMDIVIASVVGLVSLIVYPFVYLAVRLDDHGPLFITQERVGKNGKIIRMTKFRSMSSNDNGSYGGNGGKTQLTVTRVGSFTRVTRIDELPQLWSVIKGEQSLIGPRPELPALATVYEKEIPYYNARHLVKPGLSGWAQISHQAHPHHAVAIDETRDKLSYDLYYIKHRSLALDLRIALQTAKAIISRQGA
jgi:exopolysaccharide biosynthesis polyprenyl glycosylphosphotransferase